MQKWTRKNNYLWSKRGAQRDLWGKRKMSWRAAFSAAGSNARKPSNFFFSFAVLVLVLWLLHRCLPAGSLLCVCRIYTLFFSPIQRREKVKIDYSTFYIILVPDESRKTSICWSTSKHMWLSLSPHCCLQMWDIISVSVKSKSGYEAALRRTLIGSDKPYLHMRFTSSHSLSPSLWMCNEKGSWVMNTSKNTHFFYFLLLQSPVRVPMSVFFCAINVIKKVAVSK